jgi:8-oxo-dGTP pyrophosphatase MutT (NUDIX family)
MAESLWKLGPQMIDVDATLLLLHDYRLRFPEDDALVGELIGKLRSNGTTFFNRANDRGHITCGAILVDEQQRVLLIRHNTLDRWLTPGGHVESSDTSLEQAARRELAEETGIRNGVAAVLRTPVQIDRHTIPQNDRKGEGEHDHWDLRFLFKFTSGEVSLQFNEVSAYKWCALSTMPRALGRRVQAFLGP